LVQGRNPQQYLTSWAANFDSSHLTRQRRPGPTSTPLPSIILRPTRQADSPAPGGMLDLHRTICCRTGGLPTLILIRPSRILVTRPARLASPFLRPTSSRCDMSQHASERSSFPLAPVLPALISMGRRPADLASSPDFRTQALVFAAGPSTSSGCPSTSSYIPVGPPSGSSSVVCHCGFPYSGGAEGLIWCHICRRSFHKVCCHIATNYSERWRCREGWPHHVQRYLNAVMDLNS